MSELFEGIFAGILAGALLIVGFVTMVAMFAVPFLGIGIGVAGAIWLSCLPLPFC